MPTYFAEAKSNNIFCLFTLALSLRRSQYAILSLKLPNITKFYKIIVAQKYSFFSNIMHHHEKNEFSQFFFLSSKILLTRVICVPYSYSAFIEFTGLAVAALYACQPTVSNVKQHYQRRCCKHPPQFAQI